MFPSRISLHFDFKKIERVIEQTLKMQVVEQVAINQKFVAVGEHKPTTETLNLCRHNDRYVVVQSAGDDVKLLSTDQLNVLLETLPARDHFSVQRYLKSASPTVSPPKI